jgi:hypothetical protein
MAPRNSIDASQTSHHLCLLGSHSQQVNAFIRMLATGLPSLGTTTSFLSPSCAHALCLPLSPPSYRLHYIASCLEALRELMSKLNPSAQEFMPLSRRAAALTAKAGGGALSASAPVFVSAAEFFGPTGMNLPMGGGGSKDSSSDGSSNGGGHPLNRQVGEL